MSCSTLCQCQLSWPLDTQRSKRDPVNSEKDWLDSAVRLLSRKVVGKGRGQETVWSERCKPVWWDEKVRLPWKNPTSNPKDTKDILQKKYTELEKYLSSQGMFPRELEEEAKLWKEGRIKELFLLTTLTSLLGKVTGLHCAVVDACQQVDIMKAGVHISLLRDIKKCLTATLNVTENFKVSSSQSNKQPDKENNATLKGSENVNVKDMQPDVLPDKKNNVTPSKRRKLEPAANEPPETKLALKKFLVYPKNKKVEDVTLNSTLSLPKQSISHLSCPKKQEEILAVAQKILGKRKNLSINANIKGKFLDKILLKPQESVFITTLPIMCSPIISPISNGDICTSMVTHNHSDLQIADPKSTSNLSNMHSINSFNPVNFISFHTQAVAQTEQHSLFNDDRNSTIIIHPNTPSKNSKGPKFLESDSSSFVPTNLNPNTSSLDSSPSSFSSLKNNGDSLLSANFSRSSIDLKHNDLSTSPMISSAGSESPINSTSIATFDEDIWAELNKSCSTDSGFNDSHFSDVNEGSQDCMVENVKVDTLNVDEASTYLWQEDGSFNLDSFLENLD